MRDTSRSQTRLRRVHPQGLLALLLPFVLSGCFFNLDLASLTQSPPLVEHVVMGEDGPKIAMLEVQGLIVDASSRSQLGGRSPSMAARVREALELVQEDDEVVAVLLRIYSPGGTVSASETIHYQLQRFQEESDLPLIAYMHGLATSGGYYIAMASDRVIAHPTTVTGSIGVIMSGLNFAGLMERYGVEDQSFTSGDFKDSGSPFRKMRSDEREQLQSVVEDLYGRFVEVVQAGRPELTEETISGLADGRVYSAKQALQHGLIDEVAHLEDVVDAIEAAEGVSESRLVVYAPEGEYRANVYSRIPRELQIDVHLLPMPQALPAGFYYLWPAMLRSPTLD